MSNEIYRPLIHNQISAIRLAVIGFLVAAVTGFAIYDNRPVQRGVVEKEEKTKGIEKVVSFGWFRQPKVLGEIPFEETFYLVKRDKISLMDRLRNPNLNKDEYVVCRIRDSDPLNVKDYVSIRLGEKVKNVILPTGSPTSLYEIKSFKKL